MYLKSFHDFAMYSSNPIILRLLFPCALDYKITL